MRNWFCAFYLHDKHFLWKLLLSNKFPLATVYTWWDTTLNSEVVKPRKTRGWSVQPLVVWGVGLMVGHGVNAFLRISLCAFLLTVGRITLALVSLPPWICPCPHLHREGDTLFPWLHNEWYKLSPQLHRVGTSYPLGSIWSRPCHLLVLGGLVEEDTLFSHPGLPPSL